MDDYTQAFRTAAPEEKIVDALTTTTGLSAWWTAATGSALAGGEISFWFDGPDPCVMHVDRADESAVAWTVIDCAFLPDWVGTRPTFTVTPGHRGSDVAFRHRGLTRDLDCIEVCTRGWNHFMRSLRMYLETGSGAPYGSEQDRARRSAPSRR